MRNANYELTILERAESGNLPDSVSDDSIAPLDAFSELLDAGLLSGRSLRGDCGVVTIANPRITHTGRKRLAELRAKQYASTWAGRFSKWTPAVLSFVAGIGATILALWFSKLLGLGR